MARTRVTFEGFAQTHQHPVAVIPRSHFQSINHDGAGNIAQAQLPGNRGHSLGINIAWPAPGLADIGGRVDVDDAKRLGLIEDEFCPARDCNPTFQRGLDGILDAARRLLLALSKTDPETRHARAA